MQQIKDVYFFNLHNYATLLIFNCVQIKINFVRLFVRLLALQQVPLLDKKTPCTCNTGEATRHYLKTCCHSVLSLTTIRAETFNPGGTLILQPRMGA